MFCNMVRYDLKDENEFKCFAYKSRNRWKKKKHDGIKNVNLMRVSVGNPTVVRCSNTANSSLTIYPVTLCGLVIKNLNLFYGFWWIEKNVIVEILRFAVCRGVSGNGTAACTATVHPSNENIFNLAIFWIIQCFEKFTLKFRMFL